MSTINKASHIWYFLICFLFISFASCGANDEPAEEETKSELIEAPIIRISSPENGTQFSDEEITITVQILQGNIVELELLPGPVKRTFSPGLKTGDSESFSFSPLESQVEIEISATDSQGRKTQDRVIILHDEEVLKEDSSELILLSPREDFTTSKSSVDFSFLFLGKSKPTFELENNFESVALTVTGEEGRWKGQATIDLERGENKVSLRTETDPILEKNITINRTADTNAPTLENLFPKDAQDVTTRKVIVRGELEDEGELENVMIELNGNPTSINPDEDGRFQVEIGPLSRGENNLNLVAIDDSGNEFSVAWKINYGSQLAAGGAHTGAIKEGKVFTWGRNNKGQLGLGFVSTLEEATHPRLPAEVAGLGNIVALAFSQNVSLALSDNGEVYAWGDNGNGQLGLGDGLMVLDDIDRHIPEKINISNVAAIARGYSHSMILKEDGTVWTFGKNTDGQLGDGTTDPQDKPIQVPGLSDIIQISGGSKTSYALDAAGSVWAWGQDRYGNLADGMADDDQLSPVKIANLGPIAQLTTGRDHVLSLTHSGEIFAWGLNRSGQVGPEALGTPIVTPVKLDWVNSAHAVYANANQSFVLRHDERLYGWGQNLNGTLGTADDEDRPAPGDNVFGIEQVRGVGIGALHSVVRAKNGEVFAWGWSFEGSLGGGEGTINRWSYRIPIFVEFPAP